VLHPSNRSAASTPPPRIGPSSPPNQAPAATKTVEGRAKGVGKRGPKLDDERASRVAKIVKSVAPDGDWRSKLDAICEALDEAKIPSPTTWRRNPDRKYHCWSRCGESRLPVKQAQDWEHLLCGKRLRCRTAVVRLHEELKTTTGISFGWYLSSTPNPVIHGRSRIIQSGFRLGSASMVSACSPSRAT
jgi:hypothetical protein